MKIINYPNGKTVKIENKDTKVDHRKKENKTERQKLLEHVIKANMGMSFEKDISTTCDFYRARNIANIYKRPTPIRIVKMSKEKVGRIDEAYFEAKSTTDYVGIYKGKYIDFECKETIHKSIPYKMIRPQQYSHLKSVISLGGIGFFLFSFKSYDEVYLVKAETILEEINKKNHPGFNLDFVSKNGYKLKRGYNPPYNLIEVIEIAFNDLLS